MEDKQEALENKIRYKFNDRALLLRALTHSSYANEKHLMKFECNERLEFLGDAVLELVSSEFLFFKFPEALEGQLTKTRSGMVCEPSLAFCAEKIDLGSYLLLGKGEEATGGRSRASVTSDAMEALIGAIYIDGGFSAAKKFILGFIFPESEANRLFLDSKTLLQEIVQSDTDETIAYRPVREEGPDHDKTFYVEALIGGTVYGSGKGRTKKAAEQEAAYNAILRIKKER